MKQKQLFQLLGVLGLLLIVAYFAGVFDQEVSTIEVPDVDIPTDQLQQLDIALAEDSVTLIPSGARWQLTKPLEALADSITMVTFLKALQEIELESIASSNPDRYGRYGVDSTGTTLHASWSSGEQTLIIGNQGPDFQSVYVRLDDDPNVYVSRNRISVPDAVDRWRDKTIFGLPYLIVNEATVSGPDRAFELRGDASMGWQLTIGEETVLADSAAVQRWFQRFSPMSASGFLDDVPAFYVRNEPTHTITFGTTTGRTLSLWMQEQTNNMAVVNEQGQTTFSLATGRLNTFLPDPSTLKKQ